MSAGRNVALGALALGALVSNPDEFTFRRQLEAEMRRTAGNSPAAAIESRVAAYLASHRVERKNYYLFSVIRMPSDGRSYFGAFGNWIRLPGWHPKPQS